MVKPRCRDGCVPDAASGTGPPPSRPGFHWPLLDQDDQPSHALQSVLDIASDGHQLVHEVSETLGAEALEPLAKENIAMVVMAVSACCSNCLMLDFHTLTAFVIGDVPSMTRCNDLRSTDPVVKPSASISLVSHQV